MSSVLDDFRFGCRALLRSPGFTVTAVLVLGVAIGLNCAVFSVVNALLLKPLGSRGEELSGLYLRDRLPPGEAAPPGDAGVATWAYRHFTYSEYDTLRRHPGVLSSILAHQQTSVGVTEGGTSRRAFAGLVSANYFATLGVRPALGRDFRLDEERGGEVAIVSDSYWRSLGERRRLGATVKINGRDIVIVGVAPAGFSGATALFTPEIWLPLGACTITGPTAANAVGDCLASRDRPRLALVGRLPKAVRREAATAALAGVAAELGHADARYRAAPEITVGSLSRLSIGAGPSGDSEVALVMLFLAGVAGCVLLIAGVNLANMLFARGTARRRELAVRTALGSGRWRILRLLAIESALLACGGAAVGLALSVAATRLIASTVAGSLPFVLVFDATPDRRLLAATLAFSLLGGLACGLAPAIGFARHDNLAHLKGHAGHGKDGARGMSVRNALVVVQLAVSLALLTAAALFVRGSFSAVSVDAGFRPEGQVVATVSPELSGYGEAAGRQAYAQVLSGLRRQPGISSASLASAVPFGMDSEAASVRDAANPRPDASRVALVSTVGAEYFRTLGIAVLLGREFAASEEDAASASRSVIVDRGLASSLWPGADPLGQRLQLEDGDSTWSDPVHVVGVVSSVRQAPFDKEPPVHVYLPWGGKYRAQAYLHVRLSAASTDEAAVRAMRGTIRTSDPSLAILSVDTMRGHQAGSLYVWIARASAGLFSSFGLAALLLAMLGVYGVKTYLVSQRRKEIAIRMALGASRGEVLRMILGDGLTITAIGLACGVLLSLMVAQALASWVAGTGGFPWLPFAAAGAMLASAALLACWLPVRRATAGSLWSALRAE